MCIANKATHPNHIGIHVLPCLRYESQTGKPMHVSYPENPISLGDKIRKKRMDLKLLQKDVAKILGVTEDSITNWEKNRSVPQIQFFPVIIQFLEYLPFDFDLTTISGKLKTYRHLKGISQKRLGTILNVDGATVCSWEQNEFQPYERTLEKIYALFNVG